MFTCEVCGRNFTGRSNLTQHEKIHSDIRPFGCELCGRQFRNSSHLRKHHELVHNKPKPANQWQPVTLKPQICEVKQLLKTEMSRNSRSLLKSPDERLRTVKERPQILDVQILPTNYEIQKKQSALKNYRHQCQHCLKYFKEKTALTKHTRTHTGEKPYKCPCCPKAFADATNFKRHKMIHKRSATELEQLRTVSTKLLFQQQQQEQNCAENETNSICSDPDPDGLEIYEGLETYSTLMSSDTDELSDINDDATVAINWLTSSTSTLATIADQIATVAAAATAASTSSTVSLRLADIYDANNEAIIE